MATTKVTSRVLEDNSVGIAQLSAGAVTETKIANSAVTPAKLSTGAPAWNTSGFVGINTANPTTARLVVEQDATVLPATAIKFGSRGYLVSPDTFMSHNAYWTGSTGGWVNTANAASGYIGFSSDGNFNVATAPAAASPTFTTRLTILNSTGHVGLGVTPSIRLHVSGDIGATGDVFASYSDERLKTFLGKIPNALDKVNSLNGYYYKENEKAKEFGYENDKVQVGVSAQEVEKVLPEVIALAPFDMSRDEEGNLVSKSGENYKTVGYDKLVPLLIEAIKELSDKVKTLEARINS